MPAIDKFNNDAVIPQGYQPKPVTRESLTTAKFEMSAGDIIHYPLGKSQVAVVLLENFQAGEVMQLRTTIHDIYEYDGDKIVMEGAYGEQTKKLDTSTQWVESLAILDQTNAVNDVEMVRLNTWGLKGLQLECASGSNITITLSIQ